MARKEWAFISAGTVSTGSRENGKD
jgi:hypothetical protein